MSQAGRKVLPTDDARLLAAFPDYFVEAAALLEELMTKLTAYPLGGRIMLHGTVRPELMDRIACLGGCIDGHEIETDVEAVE